MDLQNCGAHPPPSKDFILSDLNEIVTGVNRTSGLLKGTYDGRPYDLAPGENKLPRLLALKFREQNPIMGIGCPIDDWNSKGDYLFGIVECGDNVFPIEQSNAPQRWDSGMINVGRTEYVPARASAYTGGERLDREFIKP